MLRSNLFRLIGVLCGLLLVGAVFVSTTAAFQGESDEEFCEMYPESCSENGGNGSGGDNNPPWDGYTDGRINPDQAEYYTIYCHEGTDTIYVIRVVPQTQTIKEIPLLDAISLAVGGELALGDNMILVKTGDNTLTIYGSNGNGAPEAGSKAFSLSDCIESNGGIPVGSGDNDTPPVEDDVEVDTRTEANESLEFCFSSYGFFGGDADLLVDCLDFTLTTYQDILTGTEIMTLIVMVFCLNLIVGNGILPIGIVLFLGLHRRWLRRWQAPSSWE